MIIESKKAAKAYYRLISIFERTTLPEESMEELFIELDENCQILSWESREPVYKVFQDYTGEENVTFFFDPEDGAYMLISTLSEEELMKRIMKFAKEKGIKI